MLTASELEAATNSSSTGEDPTAMSDTPCSCDENQVCLRVGRFGQHKCVDCKLFTNSRFMVLKPCLYHMGEYVIIHSYIIIHNAVLTEGERCDAGRDDDDEDESNDGQ